MKNTFISVIICLIFVLAACTPLAQTPVSTPVPPSATATATAEAVQSTATGEPPASTATVETTAVFTASAPATCQPSPILPQLPAEQDANIPNPDPSDWTIGPDNAAVTIYEYSDFQCPFCAKAAPVLEELQAKYPNDVRIIFRYFPLTSIHPNASLAAQAAQAAGLQNKFWQMHDLLFAQQSEWSALSTDDFTAWLKEKAVSINLNTTRFMDDLVSDTVVQRVNEAEASALASKLNSTPTLMFNKFPYGDRPDLDSLSSIVEYFLLPQKSYTSCPEMTIDPQKTYLATIKTEKGDSVLELYPDQAPWAVNSFVFLARNNWYDGSAFFRVIPGFVAQAGDPSNSSLGGPGYKYTNEVTPELRFDKAGVVGLANTGNNDNGSQFFITYAAVPELDGKYTVFGQVISGMDVFSSLRPRNPATDQILVPSDQILSITIEEK